MQRDINTLPSRPARYLAISLALYRDYVSHRGRISTIELDDELPNDRRTDRWHHSRRVIDHWLRIPIDYQRRAFSTSSGRSADLLSRATSALCHDFDRSSKRIYRDRFTCITMQSISPIIDKDAIYFWDMEIKLL